MSAPSCFPAPQGPTRPHIWGLAAAITALILLPWLLYGHTLGFVKVLDDESYVFNNPYLKDASGFLLLLDLQSLVQRCNEWGLSSDLALNFITRPVTYFTFYFNHVIGGDDTTTYRLLNIAIHMGNGLLLFVLIRRLLQKDRFTLFAAAIGSMLFVSHPLATESVTYITQRFESLAAFFCLLALLVHTMGRTATSTHQKWFFSMATISATALSMLSKETGVVTPVLMVLLDLFYYREPLRVALRRAAGSLALMPLVPLLIFLTQWFTSSGQVTASTLLNITNNGNHPYSWMEYLLTQVCAWMSYLRLLVLPVGQNFDHIYPLTTSFLDVRFITAFLLSAGLISGAWLCFRRKPNGAGAVILFGTLWYFIALLPSSSIVPLPDLFAEHRCYLPSLGVVIVLAACLHRLLHASTSSLEGRIGLYSLCSLSILLLTLSTLLRNEVLRSRESLWKDALAKGSNTARVWKGLGIVNFEHEKFDESARCFERAIQADSQDVESWHNLCVLYLRSKQPTKAIDAARRALNAKPGLVSILHLHALALIMAGQAPEGIQQLEFILQDNPTFRPAHLALAEVLVQVGHQERSLHHLLLAERSGKLDPAYASLKKTLQSRFSAMR